MRAKTSVLAGAGKMTRLQRSDPLTFELIKSELASICEGDGPHDCEGRQYSVIVREVAGPLHCAF